MKNMFWKSELPTCVWLAFPSFFLFTYMFNSSHTKLFLVLEVVWALKYFCFCCCNLNQAFDQQQEDLVDAASKALSYRQEIIEENIRLTYALQVLSSCIVFLILMCTIYLW